MDLTEIWTADSLVRRLPFQESLDQVNKDKFERGGINSFNMILENLGNLHVFLKGLIRLIDL